MSSEHTTIWPDHNRCTEQFIHTLGATASCGPCGAHERRSQVKDSESDAGKRDVAIPPHLLG
jgi:hypothetical protein